MEGLYTKLIYTYKVSISICTASCCITASKGSVGMNDVRGPFTALSGTLGLIRPNSGVCLHKKRCGIARS